MLDLGCGPGTASAHMRAAGLVPDPVDASEGMIAVAKEKHGLNARLGRFEDVDGDAVYDGVWANFSLLHAPRSDMPKYLSAVHRALKPGGAFHIALKAGEGEERDRIGRFYTYYTEAELTGLLQDAGFTPGPYRRGRDKGLSGDDADWISTTAYA